MVLHKFCDFLEFEKLLVKTLRGTYHVLCQCQYPIWWKIWKWKIGFGVITIELKMSIWLNSSTVQLSGAPFYEPWTGVWPLLVFFLKWNYWMFIIINNNHRIESIIRVKDGTGLCLPIVWLHPTNGILEKGLHCNTFQLQNIKCIIVISLHILGTFIWFWFYQIFNHLLRPLKLIRFIYMLLI